MPFALEAMQEKDIPEVVEIEKICFALPWPASAYRRELQNTSSTRYVVVRHNRQEGEEEPEIPDPDSILLSGASPVVGYAGLWMMMDEAHITTIGMHPQYRGKNLGELLLVGLIDTAMQLGSSWLTLEVRVSNVVAQNLYKKYQFHISGLRKKYYTDNNEDAYIMWSEEITKPAFREKYYQLKAELLTSLSELGMITPGLDPYQPLA
jgi:ribosomal-protein-alanine N-acetyltransferase